MHLFAAYIAPIFWTVCDLYMCAESYMHVSASICESQLRNDDITTVLYLQGAAGTPGLDVSLLNFVPYTVYIQYVGYILVNRIFINTKYSSSNIFF